MQVRFIIKKKYFSSVFVLFLFIILLGCKKNMVNNNIGPRVWFTTGNEEYLQSLLTLDLGPVPSQKTIRNYDFIGGYAIKGSWAFLACHLIHKLPDDIKKELRHYKPAEDKNSKLKYSKIIFDEDVRIETLQINNNDPLYKECILESKKQLLAKFKELVKVNPLDHHLFIYRIRFENDTLFFDIGPYTDDNLYEGFETFIEMNVGFRYYDNNRVFYSNNNISDFNIDNAIINIFQDKLTLQDISSKELVSFKYVSLPYKINFKEGTDNCEINNNKVKITYEPEKNIILVARILIKFRDYRRSGKLLLLGEKWIESDKRLSKIKDLDTPLVELYLETEEVK